MPVSSPSQENRDMADHTQPATDETQQLTDEQRAQLEDDDVQAKYQAAYEQQLRLRSCPGCGETGIF